MSFYRLEKHEPVACSLKDWANAFDKDEDRRVARTEIGDISISTVFLGMDHRMTAEGPPVLFETMIFGGPRDQYQERYCTWYEAEAGHKRAVELAQVPYGEDE